MKCLIELSKKKTPAAVLTEHMQRVVLYYAGIRINN